MQKVIRKIGIFETLFAITFLGIFVTFPFAYKNFSQVFTWGDALFVLIVSSAVLFLAAILDFMALKIGKLSVVEPIWSIEIISTSLLAFFILKESISLLQILIIFTLISGLILVSIENINNIKSKDFLERGAILAFVAAVTMGVANFLFGWSARLSDAFVVNFFTCAFLSFLSFLIILFKGELSVTFKKIWNYRKVVLPMSILDNFAWIAFAKGMSLSPIAIVTALSQSYIIIAVLLGLFVTKERLVFHQKFGLSVSITFAIILALIS
jgi:drug/metabolite transporter (DMT)-like permease